MKAVKKVGFTPHQTKKVILAISIPLGLLVLFYTIAVIIDKNYWDKPFKIKSSGWFWLAYAISVVLAQLKLFKQKKNLLRILRKIKNLGYASLQSVIDYIESGEDEYIATNKELLIENLYNNMSPLDSQDNIKDNKKITNLLYFRKNKSFNNEIIAVVLPL